MVSREGLQRLHTERNGAVVVPGTQDCKEDVIAWHACGTKKPAKMAAGRGIKAWESGLTSPSAVWSSSKWQTGLQEAIDTIAGNKPRIWRLCVNRPCQQGFLLPYYLKVLCGFPGEIGDAHIKLKRLKFMLKEYICFFL